MIRTCLTDAFDLSCPVISEGIPFAAHPRLTAAVSNAGGMGLLGAAASSPTRVVEMIHSTRRLTTRPFGISISAAVVTENVLECCLDERPAVVAFTRDEPNRAWIEELRRADIAVWRHAASPAEARHAARQGADAVIVEGTSIDTPPYWDLINLLPAVADAIHPLPMIAVGGIADGRRLATALALGADACCCGTRFLASREVFDLTYRPPIVDKLSGMRFSAEWDGGDLCGLQGRPRDLFTIADVNPFRPHASPLCLRHPFETAECEPFKHAWPLMSAAEIVNMLSRDAARVLVTLHARLNAERAP
jgi:hypothetical protein